MIKKKRQQHNTAGFRTAHNSGYTPLKRRIAADVSGHCNATQQTVTTISYLWTDKFEMKV